MKNFFHNRAFTLIELLASISVLLVLFLIFGQIITTINHATRQSSQRVDLMQAGTFVLDRISDDLYARSRRADQPFVVSATNTSNSLGNASLDFYAHSAAYSGNRKTLTQISYRIYNQDPETLKPVAPQLQRATIGLYWSGSTPQAVFSPIPLLEPPSAPANNQYQTLSANVIALKITYLLKNSGTLTTSGETYSGSYAIPLNPASGNYAALMVSLAMLDANTRKAITDNGVTTVMNACLDVANTDGDTVKAWNQNLFSTNSPLPSLARQNIKFIQRLIPLN